MERAVDPYADRIAALRACFASGRTRTLEWRRRQLDGLRRMMVEEEGPLAAALADDLGRPLQEAWVAELSMVRAEAEHASRRLPRWMAPRRVPTPLVAQPGSSRLVPEPLGVVLVVGAWNYPVQLALSPLVGALAAGNCAVLKPSELSAATSRLLARLVPRYLDPEAVAVVEGGVDETTALLAHRFDHILYTGNGTVGRIVMAAAARHLTPVTLELGGKSPCIVTRSADLDLAARRIAWGKFINAGQTCIAPDYVLVEPALADALTGKLHEAVRRMYGDDPRRSPDYGRIVAERHVRRIAGYLEAGRVAFGGEVDVAARYVAPTVLRDVPPDAPVLEHEIFGPVLPIVEVPDARAAVAHVLARDKPLALYVFGDATEADPIVDAISAGNVCVNDTMMFMAVPELPFGGVGASGMGAYTGSHGFRTFSHLKPVMRRGAMLDLDARYPPYTPGKLGLLRRLK
ncbi:MAG TPA: aldehyde dehydrogenase family protein [Burkholderiaceae bacterium]|nr:aldehyde dehydrogenase family protein [Burkholderiaceae bacterium]